MQGLQNQCNSTPRKEMNQEILPNQNLTHPQNQTKQLQDESSNQDFFEFASNSDSKQFQNNIVTNENVNQAACFYQNPSSDSTQNQLKLPNLPLSSFHTSTEGECLEEHQNNCSSQSQKIKDLNQKHQKVGQNTARSANVTKRHFKGTQSCQEQEQCSLKSAANQMNQYLQTSTLEAALAAGCCLPSLTNEDHLCSGGTSSCSLVTPPSSSQQSELLHHVSILENSAQTTTNIIQQIFSEAIQRKDDRNLKQSGAETQLILDNKINNNGVQKEQNPVNQKEKRPEDYRYEASENSIQRGNSDKKQENRSDHIITNPNVNLLRGALRNLLTADDTERERFRKQRSMTGGVSLGDNQKDLKGHQSEEIQEDVSGVCYQTLQEKCGTFPANQSNQPDFRQIDRNLVNDQQYLTPVVDANNLTSQKQDLKDKDQYALPQEHEQRDVWHLKTNQSHYNFQARSSGVNTESNHQRRRRQLSKKFQRHQQNQDKMSTNDLVDPQNCIIEQYDLSQMILPRRHHQNAPTESSLQDHAELLNSSTMILGLTETNNTVDNEEEEVDNQVVDKENQSAGQCVTTSLDQENPQNQLDHNNFTRQSENSVDIGDSKTNECSNPIARFLDTILVQTDLTSLSGSSPPVTEMTTKTRKPIIKLIQGGRDQLDEAKEISNQIESLVVQEKQDSNQNGEFTASYDHQKCQNEMLIEQNTPQSSFVIKECDGKFESVQNYSEEKQEVQNDAVMDETNSLNSSSQYQSGCITALNSQNFTDFDQNDQNISHQDSEQETTRSNECLRPPISPVKQNSAVASTRILSIGDSRENHANQNGTTPQPYGLAGIISTITQNQQQDSFGTQTKFKQKELSGSENLKQSPSPVYSSQPAQNNTSVKPFPISSAFSFAKTVQNRHQSINRQDLDSTKKQKNQDMVIANFNQALQESKFLQNNRTPEAIVGTNFKENQTQINNEDIQSSSQKSSQPTSTTNLNPNQMDSLFLQSSQNQMHSFTESKGATYQHGINDHQKMQ